MKAIAHTIATTNAILMVFELLKTENIELNKSIVNSSNKINDPMETDSNSVCEHRIYVLRYHPLNFYFPNRILLSFCVTRASVH